MYERKKCGRTDEREHDARTHLIDAVDTRQNNLQKCFFLSVAVSGPSSASSAEYEKSRKMYIINHLATTGGLSSKFDICSAAFGARSLEMRDNIPKSCETQFDE